MANQQLLEFIQQSKNNGLSDEQIRQTLLSSGWAVSDIEQAINSYSTSTSANIQNSYLSSIWHTAATYGFLVFLFSATFTYFAQRWFLDYQFYVSDFLANMAKSWGISDVLVFGIYDVSQAILLVLLSTMVGILYTNRYLTISVYKKFLIIATLSFATFSLIHYLILSGIFDSYSDLYLSEILSEAATFALGLLASAALFYFLSKKYIHGKSREPRRFGAILNKIVLALIIYIGLVFLMTGINYFSLSGGNGISFDVSYNQPNIEEVMTFGLLRCGGLCNLNPVSYIFYLFRLFPSEYFSYTLWQSLSSALFNFIFELGLIVAFVHFIIKRWPKAQKFPWIFLIVGLIVYSVATIHYQALVKKDLKHQEEYEEQYRAKNIESQSSSINSQERFIYSEKKFDKATNKDKYYLTVSDIDESNKVILAESQDENFNLVAPTGEFYLATQGSYQNVVKKLTRETVYNFSDDLFFHRWSPNGKYILVGRRKSFPFPVDIVLHDIEKKKSTVVATITQGYNDYNTQFGWSEDSQKIYYSTKTGIYVIDNTSAMRESDDIQKPSVKLLDNLVPCAPLINVGDTIYCAISTQEARIQISQTENEYTNNKTTVIIAQSLNQKDKMSFRVINKDTPTSYARDLAAIDSNYLFVDMPGEDIELFGILSILDLNTGKFINTQRYQGLLVFKKSYRPQRYFGNQ